MQLEAAQLELLQVSSSARERETAAKHGTDKMSARLAEVEAQLAGREKEAATLAQT